MTTLLLSVSHTICVSESEVSTNNHYEMTKLTLPSTLTLNTGFNFCLIQGNHKKIEVQ